MATNGYIFIEEVPFEIQRPPFSKKALATSITNVDGIDIHSLKVIFAAEEGNAIEVVQPTGANLHVMVDAGTISLPSGAATAAYQEEKISILSQINDKTVEIDTGNVSISTELPSGSNIIGKVGIDQTTPGTTNKVFIGNDGQVAATQSGSWSVSATNSGIFAIQDSEKIADNAPFTDGASKVQPIGYIFDESSGIALTENDIGAARIDSKRAQVFVIEDATTRGQRVSVNSENALKTDNLGSTPITISNLTNSAQNVVTSPAKLCHIRCNNTLGVTVFIQVFNDLQGNAVLGTPTTYFEIPAYSNLNENFFSPPKFSTAISVALTTAKNNAVAPPSPLDVIAHYSTLN